LAEFTFRTFNIGYAYYHGAWVKLDIKKALKYFVLSAEQSHAEAQFACGRVYDKGYDGMERDRSKALKYYTSAAAQGHEEAPDAVHTLLNNWSSEVL
jgi:TPR repeat protein